MNSQGLNFINSNARVEYLTYYRNLNENKVIDKLVAKRFGRLALDIDDLDVDEATSIINGVLAINKKKYEQLYELYLLTYDPISNYDRTEVTTTVEGARSDSNSIGAQTNSSTIGQQKTDSHYGEINSANIYGEQNNTETIGGGQTTNVYGAVSQSDIIGATTETTSLGSTNESTTMSNTSTTTTLGSHTDTGKSGRAGFNSDTTHKATDTENTYGEQINVVATLPTTSTVASLPVTNTVGNAEHTNSHTETARTDTITDASRSNSSKLGTHTDSNSTDEHDDSITVSSRNDSETLGARSDSFNKGEQTNTINSRIKGNIGVTTTQQMALSEVDLWSRFNFIGAMIDDVVMALTIPMYL